MATTVARLEAVLSADTRGFDRAMSRSQTRMGTIGKAAGIAGAALGGVLAIGGRKAIKAASDLNEEIDKSEVVFGKASASVLKWSGGTASSLGLSRRMSLQAAGAYGNMFKTIGLGDKPAADMSRRMVTLAADMASFSNEDPSDMLLKLRGGLAGEAEPLRQFGVLLSEARVKTEAYRMGLAKVGGKLTEQQKVQARYSLILKDSAVQHGNFALTADSAANRQRVLRAQVEDLSAKLGNALLPAFKAVLAVVIEAVNFFSEHTTLAKVLGVALGVLAGALLAVSVATTLMNLAFLASPVGLVILSIAALAAGLVVAYRKSETFRDIVKKALDIVKVAGDALATVFKWFRDNSGTIWATVQTATYLPTQLIKGYIKAIDTAADAVRAVFGWFRDNAGTIWNGVQTAVNAPVNAIKDALNLADRAADKVKAGFVWMRDLGGAALQAAWTVAKLPLDALKDAFTRVANAIQRIKDILVWIKDNIENVLGKVGGAVEKVGGVLGKIPGVGDVAAGVNSAAAARARPGYAVAGLQPQTQGFLNTLNKLFDEFVVSSGFRTPEQNRAVRGASNSDHLTGRAFDLVPKGGWTAAGISHFDKIAAYAAMSPLVRWIGWRGVPGHGPGDHLHVSTYDQGGFLRPGWNLAYNGLGRPEPVGAGNVTFNFPNYVGSKQELISFIQNAGQEFRRRNGRGLV